MVRVSSNRWLATDEVSFGLPDEYRTAVVEAVRSTFSGGFDASVVAHGLVGSSIVVFRATVLLLHELLDDATADDDELLFGRLNGALRAANPDRWRGRERLNSEVPVVATITLFRPVGQRELDLIEASGWRSFPSRLDWQPIFYPVLTEAYATRIARDWNTKDEENGSVGYVLRFSVSAEFLSRYDVQDVGGRELQEYWIPAEDLAAFNDHIVGEIEILAEYRGDPPQRIR